MIPTKNILYLGPYMEESSRGYYSCMNIKALEKAGHNIKIIPLYSSSYLPNKISSDILHLEEKNLEKYDVCIQHCNPLQYVHNSYFEQNIGIYDFVNLDPNPIVNSNLFLLDKILVNSPNKLTILADILAPHVFERLQYSPQLIDVNHIQNKKQEKLEWVDENRFYFYSELEFSEQYDWEKLIYVYLTNFMDKNTGLIIKTNNISEDKIKIIKQQIYGMASSAMVKPIPEAMPQVLNGVYDEQTMFLINNSSDCFIDINKANEPSYSSLCFAALNKPIISHENSTTASYFKNTIKVDNMISNSLIKHGDDIMNNSITNYYYTLNSESLLNNMRKVYQDRHNKNQINYDNDIHKYDLSQINYIL